MADVTSQQNGHAVSPGTDEHPEVLAVSDETPLLAGVNGPEPYLYQTLTAQESEGEAWLTTEEHGSLRRVSTVSVRSPGIYATLSVMLVGVFVSQTDQSLVLATYGKVASEFDDLANASWLMSACILATCVAQPLYGKLSQIYGRKTCLQAAYTLFALGILGCGLGRNMGEVIAGRVIQGIGGAGMLSMVSIIITELVPVHEVGSLRSYVNILQTTGRGCGGVIGGYLTQTIGWRWAFLVQVPPMIIAIALVQWRLHLPSDGHSNMEQSAWTKLKRIDFVGALFLCLTIGAWCFVLESAGQKVSWTSTIMIASIVVGAVSAVAFVISGHYAAEPIFPLRLWVQRAVVTNYAIVTLQTMTQVSLMAAVPLFVQATAKVSMAGVGAYLIPAFVGNTFGGLLAGYWVKRTRTHKPITIFGPILGIACSVLLFLLWQGTGQVSFWKSLVILPGGFAVGVVANSAFVALTAGVNPDDVAIAGSGMYMFFSIGAIAGVTAGAATYQSTLASGLENALQDVKDGDKILRRALDDVSYVQSTDPEIRKLLVPSFVDAFHNVNILQLACSILSLIFAIISPASRLKPPPKSHVDEEAESSE